MSRGKKYTEVNLMITTRCNRHCAECCFHSLLERSAEDVPLETILKVLPFLQGSSKIFLCGGEPALYSGLPELIDAVWRIAKPDRLAFVTNGVNLEAVGGRRIDEFWFNDNYATDDMIRWVRINYPKAGINRSGPFITTNPTGRGTPCARNGIAAVLGDKAYPCCIGPEFESCPTVPVAPDWRTDLCFLRPPCGQCRFTGQKIMK